MELQRAVGALPVDGAPELIAQMLDKLVANAIEFSTAGTPVVISLQQTDATAQLWIDNIGASAAAGEWGALFDSMVSPACNASGRLMATEWRRSGGAQKSAHLNLIWDWDFTSFA